MHCLLLKLTLFPLFEHLYSDVKPIVTKSRRFSTPDKQFIDSKIENLLSDNVIEPSSSPWRAQVMVTKNENHRPRLVIDYSQTINKFTKLDAYPLPNIHDIVHKAAQYTVLVPLISKVLIIKSRCVKLTKFTLVLKPLEDSTNSREYLLV